MIKVAVLTYDHNERVDDCRSHRQPQQRDRILHSRISQPYTHATCYCRRCCRHIVLGQLLQEIRFAVRVAAAKLTQR